MADDLRIRSLVKGVVIEFGISELSTMLGISPAGSLEYMGARTTAKKEFDDSIRDEIFGTIMTSHTTGIYRIKETALRPTPRIVSRIIQHNILPRRGNRDDMRTFQIYLTYCIMTGKQVNLPFIIMRYMSDQQSRPISCLPYGKLLGRIFQHFGVDVTGEDISPDESPINALTISQMSLDRETPRCAAAPPPPPTPMADNLQHGEGSSTGNYVTSSEFHSFTQRFETRMDALQSSLGLISANVVMMGRNQGELNRQNEMIKDSMQRLYQIVSEMEYVTPSPPHPPAEAPPPHQATQQQPSPQAPPPPQ